VHFLRRLNANIIWIALALLVMNGLVFLIEERLSVPFRISLYVAIVLLFYYFLVNAYAMIKSLRKRSVRESIVVIFLIPVLFGVLSIVYMISDGHKVRYDLTASARFTLSEQSIKILQNLELPVEVLCYFKDGQPGKDMLKTGLEQYAYYSDNIAYEFIDPDLYPMRAKEFGVENYGEIIVRSERGMERLQNATDEESITNAILKATATEKKAVYFVAGHGEPDLNAGDRKGYSLLKQHLELENYSVNTLSLMRTSEIPANAACIILSAPQTDLFDEEIDLLQKYVFEDQGSLLILVDNDVPQTMREFVDSLGVELGQNVVIDKMSQLFGASYDTAVITHYGEHDITRKFTVAAFFPTASSLTLKEEIPHGLTGLYLAYSGQGSWAETDLETLRQGKAVLDENDVAGPVSVGVVISQTEEGAAKTDSKIVIFGDSDFVSNSRLKLSGNKDLFLNTIAWLSGDDVLISIRPKEVDATPLFLRKRQSIMLFIIPVIFVPLVFISIGIIRLIQRRQ